MATVRELMEKFENGGLSIDQLAHNLKQTTITQEPHKSLAETYHDAEGTPADNDLFWLDSALNRGVIDPDQHQHLLQSRQHSSL